MVLLCARASGDDQKDRGEVVGSGLPVYAWYDVLWGLESGENGTRRMHELADVLVIERYNLTRLMDRLEKSSWSRVFDRMTIAGPPSRLSPRKARPCGKDVEIYRSVVNTHFLNQFSEEEVARFSDALNNAMQLARE